MYDHNMKKHIESNGQPVHPSVAYAEHNMNVKPDQMANMNRGIYQDVEDYMRRHIQ